MGYFLGVHIINKIPTLLGSRSGTLNSGNPQITAPKHSQETRERGPQESKQPGCHALSILLESLASSEEDIHGGQHQEADDGKEDCRRALLSPRHIKSSGAQISACYIPERGSREPGSQVKIMTMQQLDL